MGDSEEIRPKPWWRTIPAILTALASLIGAVTGLIALLWPTELPDQRNPRDDAAVGLPDNAPDAVWHEARGHWDQIDPMEL